MVDLLTALKGLLRRRGIHAHLFTYLPNVRYLCGFTGSSGWLLVIGETCWFITDGRYRTQAHDEVAGADVIVARGALLDEVEHLIRGRRIRSIGVDAGSITLELASMLRRRLGVRLRATRGLVEQMRTVKTPEEIRHLRRAVRKAEAALGDIKGMIGPGTTEREIAVSLEAAIKRRGSSRLPFDAIVASGPQGALPHARPGGRTLRSGDLVVVDWGGEDGGYFSDMTRTFCVGFAAGDAKRIYDIVLRARTAAVRAVAPGVLCRDVDAAARRVIVEAGMGEFFSHGTGHGVGIEVHEAPTLSSRAKGRLEEGMVVTVEPGIYVPGLGGVRIEDMVLVTGNGRRTLTHLPRRLECLR